MQLKRQQHLVAIEDAADVDPRTCPFAGAVACTYWRWFRRSDMQQREQRRHVTSILSLPASASKVSRLLRFRLGCQDLLPVMSGRYRQVPRHQRLCRHCLADCVDDEKHLIFECSALDHIRHKFSVLFINHHSVRSFMNQVSQRDVLHFVCDCLDYYSLLADVGVAEAQMMWTAELIFRPVGGHLQRVQPDGGGKLHPAAAAMMQFERQPARWRIMCYLQRLHSTIAQHTVWQLVFECVTSPQKFSCYRTRGIIVGPQLASFVCVLVSLVCQRPMRRLC